MGTFPVEIETGDPQGERFERLSALVEGLLMRESRGGPDAVAATFRSPPSLVGEARGELKLAATFHLFTQRLWHR